MFWTPLSPTPTSLFVRLWGRAPRPLLALAVPAAAVPESRPPFVVVGVVVVSAVLYVGPCADGVQSAVLLPAQALSRCPGCDPWLRVFGVVHPMEEFVRSGVPGEGVVRRRGIALHRVGSVSGAPRVGLLAVLVAAVAALAPRQGQLLSFDRFVRGRSGRCGGACSAGLGRGVSSRVFWGFSGGGGRSRGGGGWACTGAGADSTSTETSAGGGAGGGGSSKSRCQLLGCLGLLDFPVPLLCPLLVFLQRLACANVVFEILP